MPTESWSHVAESPPAQPQVGWRAVIGALVRSPLILLLPLLAFGLGTWANWPWLAAEHERLEPWKVPIIWLGECVALFWYLLFSVRYTRAWAQAGEGPPAKVARRRGLALLVVSLVLGIGADLAVTLITLLEEDAAHGRSQQVVAEVVDRSVRHLRNGQTLVTLSARFRDPQGKMQQVTLFAGDRELPAAGGQSLAARQFPVALNIRYDPSWPGRSWIDSMANPHHNRLYLMSFCVISFQVILGVALIALSRHPQVRMALPVEVCSFLAVAVVLAASGFGKFLLGEAF